MGVRLCSEHKRVVEFNNPTSTFGPSPQNSICDFCQKSSDSELVKLQEQFIILVTGARDWPETSVGYNVIEKALVEATRGLIARVRIFVLEGGASGADKVSKQVAKQLGFESITEPAQWGQYGKRAGPIRNQRMLDRRPDYILAFHDDLSKSKGTKDMVERSLKVNRVVFLYNTEGKKARLTKETYEFL